MAKTETQYSLTIGWLYPELMSTYGDRGNILCLQKRCLWRNIAASVLNLDKSTSTSDLLSCDIVVGGGAQDRQQELAISDLLKHKKKPLFELFNSGRPGLFVCGSPQLLGEYYMTGEGKKLPGLELFDYSTRHFGNTKPRCIGNTAGDISNQFTLPGLDYRRTIVGFENHGGRTYLGKTCRPFAKVLAGFGNNGEDGTEGAIYNNVIACYYHGPFLPKNPHIADWLISKALKTKYRKNISLNKIDDLFEWKAHDFMLKRLGIR